MNECGWCDRPARPGSRWCSRVCRLLSSLEEDRKFRRVRIEEPDPPPYPNFYAALRSALLAEQDWSHRVAPHPKLS